MQNCKLLLVNQLIIFIPMIKKHAKYDYETSRSSCVTD